MKEHQLLIASGVIGLALIVASLDLRRAPYQVEPGPGGTRWVFKPTTGELWLVGWEEGKGIKQLGQWGGPGSRPKSMTELIREVETEK